MTSKSEAAMVAFVVALRTKAALPGSKLVRALRNEDIVSRLAEVGAGLAIHLNVWDGDRPQPEKMLGADLGVSGGYDVVLQVRLELAVAGGEDDGREARFDDCRKEIWDALKPAIVDGAPVYLGGAVDRVELIDYAPPGSGLATDGLPNVKAAVFTFALHFTSDEPF